MNLLKNILSYFGSERDVDVHRRSHGLVKVARFSASVEALKRKKTPIRKAINIGSMNFIFVRKMEQEVTVLGERGQVVIPKEVRMRLGLKPKTKLLVVRRGDAVVMRKLDLEQERRELEALLKRVDKRIEKHGEMTEEEIDKIIHEYRAKTVYKGK